MKTLNPFISTEPSELKVNCPADKSLTHRAIIFASIAKGISTIQNPLLGEDCRSTMSCFEKLGVRFTIDPDSQTVSVDSPGIHALIQPTEKLDCGNSGTTARLLSGLFAGCSQIQTTLTGDDSLSSRPMARVVDPLRKMGAQISGKQDGNLLPLTISGSKLTGGDFTIDKATAQVKSALLLACINSDDHLTVRLPRGSRDHTEKLLQKFGANLKVEIQGNTEIIHFQGPFEAKPTDFLIPTDPSSAAFFCAAGLLRKNGHITVPNILDNPTRLGFLKCLQRMTPEIRCTPSPNQKYLEEVVDVTVRGGISLEPLNIEAHEVPTLVDEIPILAVLASFANGVSRFSGLGELRVKESDRLQGTAKLLASAGIVCHIDRDTLTIQGNSGKTVASFQADPQDDHRMAMAAAVLAKKTEKGGSISNPECVTISFPNFFQLLATLDEQPNPDKKESHC